MPVNVDGNASAQIDGLRLSTTDPSYGTAPSATGVFPVSTAFVRHNVHKVKVTKAALTAAATTQDITLWTTPANTRVVRVIAKCLTNFTGGSISAMTITVGSSAGGNQYLLSGSVFSGTPTLGDVVAEMGAGVVSATLADFSGSAITIQTRFTSTSDNVNAATAGEIDFYIETISYAGL